MVGEKENWKFKRQRTKWVLRSIKSLSMSTGGGKSFPRHPPPSPLLSTHTALSLTHYLLSIFSHCGVWFGTWSDLASEVRRRLFHKMVMRERRMRRGVILRRKRFSIPLAILYSLSSKQALKTFIFLPFIAPPTVIRQCMPIRTFRNHESGELILTEGLIRIGRAQTKSREDVNLIRLHFCFSVSLFPSFPLQ